MDRQSFIKQTYLTNGNRCGLDDCECEEVKRVKDQRSFHLFSVAVLAFLCASVLVQWKLKASSVDSLRDKKSNIVSCDYNKSLIKKAVKDAYTNHQPSDNKNGNSCPHQWSAACAGCVNDLKRKRNYPG